MCVCLCECVGECAGVSGEGRWPQLAPLRRWVGLTSWVFAHSCWHQVYLSVLTTSLSFNIIKQNRGKASSRSVPEHSLLLPGIVVSTEVTAKAERPKERKHGAEEEGGELREAPGLGRRVGSGGRRS